MPDLDGGASDGRPRVWRVVWEQAGLTFRSDWTIHYDTVREFKRKLSLDAPGVDAEMQSAAVSGVSDVEPMEFPNDENGDVGPRDSPATIGGIWEGDR